MSTALAVGRLKVRCSTIELTPRGAVNYRRHRTKAYRVRDAARSGAPLPLPYLSQMVGGTTRARRGLPMRPTGPLGTRPQVSAATIVPVTSGFVHDTFFEPAGPGSFVATGATAGPWSAGAQHGGPPSALA